MTDRLPAAGCCRIVVGVAGGLLGEELELVLEHLVALVHRNVVELQLLLVPDYLKRYIVSYRVSVITVEKG